MTGYNPPPYDDQDPVDNRYPVNNTPYSAGQNQYPADPNYNAAWQNQYHDPAAQTQPIRPVAPRPVYPVEQMQPVRVQQGKPTRQRPYRRRGCMGSCLQFGCLGVVLALVAVLAYFLAPLRTNLLVLGIDRTEDGSATGRSDTIILTSVVPLKPDVHMLSIPRDLWVNVPGVGEQRINTAHFFAEARETGSGPAAALETVEQNFGVDVPYYVRIRFDSFGKIIDAMGGVTVNFPEDMSGYTAGEHHLNGEQALAFVRDRKGADDFFRMSHGQLLIRSVVRQLLLPSSWANLPTIYQVGQESVETNIPWWHWPRLGLALARAGVGDGIDSRTIGRDMVTPFTTDGGANVLLPDWNQINPVLKEMFGT